jgi:hypothetical protein
MVHHVLQETPGNVRMAVRQANGIVGSTHDFYVIGRSVAQRGKARNAPITPMNTTHSTVTATITDLYAGDWCDKLDQAKTQINELEALAGAGARAIERAIEQDLLSTMVTGAGTARGTLDVSTTAKIRTEANTCLVLMWENEFEPDNKAYTVVSPRFYQRLMFLDDFASADFVGADGLPFQDGPATRGKWKSWGGALWQQSTLLPGFGTSTSDCVAFDGRCVGYVDNGGVVVDITWHGDRASHFVNHCVGTGYCVIDANGVISWNIDDTAALPAS